jgi:hypothetical protein
MKQLVYYALLLIFASSGCIASDGTPSPSYFETFLAFVMPTKWYKLRLARQMQVDHFKEQNSTTLKHKEDFERSLAYGKNISCMGDRIVHRDKVFSITSNSEKTVTAMLKEKSYTTGKGAACHRDTPNPATLLCTDPIWQALLKKLPPTRFKYATQEEDNAVTTHNQAVTDKNTSPLDEEISHYTARLALYQKNAATKWPAPEMSKEREEVLEQFRTKHIEVFKTEEPAAYADYMDLCEVPSAKTREQKKWETVAEHVSDHLDKLKLYKSSGSLAEKPVYQTPKQRVKESDNYNGMIIIKEHAFYKKLIEQFPTIFDR